MSQLEEKKMVLIIEDDAGMIADLKPIFRPYEEFLEVLWEQTAGGALKVMQAGKWPQAFVLDLMLAYGGASEILDGQADTQEIETGLKLLEWLRRREKEEGNQASYVFVITGRSSIAVAVRLKELLNGCGRVFYKPFDTLELEERLTHALDIKSELHPSLSSKFGAEDSGSRE